MQWSSLLLAVADPLDAAERAQGILDKGLATGVIVGMGAAIIVLFGALMHALTTSPRRLESLLERTVTHIEQNTAATLAQTEVLEEMREHLPRRRRAPQLGQEPRTGGGA